jgi:hypothetical protein
MRTFVAIVMGFLSGVMLFLLAAMLIGVTISAAPSIATAFVALLAACAFSAYLLRRNAATTSVVLRRGFLLGAGEWLAVIPATWESPEGYRNLPNALPAIIGAAFIFWLAAAMVAICLIAFGLAHFAGRRVESP